jgi:hypothetical protein
MSRRVAIIETCGDCPHFDNEYYNYSAECTKLRRKIGCNGSARDSYTIPEDCPLPEEPAEHAVTQGQLLTLRTAVSIVVEELRKEGAEVPPTDNGWMIDHLTEALNGK